MKNQMQTAHGITKKSIKMDIHIQYFKKAKTTNTNLFTISKTEENTKKVGILLNFYTQTI